MNSELKLIGIIGISSNLIVCFSNFSFSHCRGLSFFFFFNLNWWCRLRAEFIEFVIVCRVVVDGRGEWSSGGC